MTTVCLDGLDFAVGGHILVAHAVRRHRPGDTITVRGGGRDLRVHLQAWCRAHGCRLDGDEDGQVRFVLGPTVNAELARAERAGDADPTGVVGRAPAQWGLAARGALVEPGAPPADFDLDSRQEVWADAAPRLYAQAAAAQWDPNTAVDWAAEFTLPEEVEDAVVQVMTYLVENEHAALAVPARFLGRIHPHYREVVQFLAVQAADEARHLEVFSRRAALSGRPLGVSGAGGRASLQTLLAEPDFTLAHFLLSVLGEGTFLNLLEFIERHAPDPVTARITHLALGDEHRHVAFGMAHLLHRLSAEPGLRGRLAGAIRRRHDALADTAGLNAGVYDALVVLAAGAWTPAAIRCGAQAVAQLQRDMDTGRRRRLRRLGFTREQAAELSDLHTRNFM